jgi:glycosyltransferase involved in cell wall biosynthesis
MSPEVSIIIPTYKRTAKLERALASIPSACSVSYEVIVIDDCPEGSAAPIARQTGSQYVCKKGENRGLSKSRNIGLQMARGKYVAFLDDDDFYIPNAIDSLCSKISEGQQLAFGNYVNLLNEGQILYDMKSLTFDHLLVSNRIPVGSYLVRRSTIIHHFDERMRSHEDWDFLLQHGNWSRWVHVPNPVVVIDKTENFETSMQARRRKYFWLDFISIYSRFPAPHLKYHRHEMLLSLGVNIDANLLENSDEI